MSVPLMKPRLIPGLRVPYGGNFQLNIPERGIVGSGSTFNQLLIYVEQYRRANGFPLGLGWRDEVETELCHNYPQECEETDARVPQRNVISFSDIIAGTKTMIRDIAAGRPLVSQEEAERRAAICVACPNNVTFSMPCGGLCGELKQIVDAVTGAKQTAESGRLKSCAVCRCFLNSAVWLPLEVQWPVVTQEQAMQFEVARELHNCWKGPPSP